MWAEPVSAVLFRLRSVAFYAYGVSNGALIGCTTWGFETICRRG